MYFPVIMRIITHIDECNRVLPFEISPVVSDIFSLGVI